MANNTYKIDTAPGFAKLDELDKGATSVKTDNGWTWTKNKNGTYTATNKDGVAMDVEVVGRPSSPTSVNNGSSGGVYTPSKTEKTKVDTNPPTINPTPTNGTIASDTTAQNTIQANNTYKVDSAPGYAKLKELDSGVGSVTTDNGWTWTKNKDGSYTATNKNGVSMPIEVVNRPADTSGLGFDNSIDYDKHLTQYAEEIKNGDLTHIAEFYNYMDARNKKIDYLNSTGTNKFGAVYNDYGLMKNGVVTAPTSVWKYNKDMDGNLSWEEITGAIAYDPSGKGTYTYADGTELNNGDVVRGADGEFQYYDSETGAFVDRDAWLAKYNEIPLSQMSDEELLEYLMNMYYDTGSEEVNLDPFMTWAEASAIAGERYNPIYNQSLNKTLANIDKAALPSGFYGQLPTEALKQQAAASAEAERTAAINELAESLMNDDRDTAFAKFNALLEAKQINMNDILELINLATQYNAEGGTIGTTGQLNGGQTITLPGGEVLNPTNNIQPEGATEQPTEQPNPAPKTPGTNPTPQYDSGAPTKQQIATIQAQLGITADGIWGQQSQAAAGGLTAAEAYAQLNDANYTNFLNEVMRLAQSGDMQGAQELYNSDAYRSLTEFQRTAVNKALTDAGLVGGAESGQTAEQRAFMDALNSAWLNDRDGVPDVYNKKPAAEPKDTSSRTGGATPPGAGPDSGGGVSYTYTAPTGYGAKGDKVTSLQKALAFLGLMGMNAVDGIFGSQTRDAVRKFQSQNGLTVDGYVGTDTGKAIEAALNKKVFPGLSDKYGENTKKLSGGGGIGGDI